jgi:hypothetical protein
MAGRTKGDTGGILQLNEEEDDFGFTFADSEELKAQVDDKVEGLRKMIMPLLNNLLKNPDKDTIVWPNRDKSINAFIKKMDDYINS